MIRVGSIVRVEDWRPVPFDGLVEGVVRQWEGGKEEKTSRWLWLLLKGGEEVEVPLANCVEID